jgi:hypothetical protein
MLTIEKIDTTKKDQVRRFTRLPFRLYHGHPQWVPPLLVDSETQLNRKKHPFFEHSQVDFSWRLRTGATPAGWRSLRTAPSMTITASGRPSFTSSIARMTRKFLTGCSSVLLNGRTRAAWIRSSVPKVSAHSMGMGCWWKVLNTAR